MNCNLEKPITVGKLGSAVGIHGWLKLFSFTKEYSSIIHYQPWFVKKFNYWNNVKLKKWKNLKNGLLVKFDQINNRNDAKFLTNCEIVIDYRSLPRLVKGEYYWEELIGCSVLSDKQTIGTIINLIETGSNDVLVIKMNNNSVQLVPFLDGVVVKKVNLVLKFVVINWQFKFN